MDRCGFSQALLLLELMHVFMSEKQKQRVPALDAAGVEACSGEFVCPIADSFLFSGSELKFRSAQDALDAAVAYLACPSPPHLLNPVALSTHALAATKHEAAPSLIVLMGADSLPLVQDAVALFISSWYASGCRRVVITGGIGRATPDLIKSFQQRTAHHQAADNRANGAFVHLPFAHALGGPQSLPLLDDYSKFSLAWPPAVVAQSASAPPPPPPKCL
jgi:hypothetical protein